MYIVSVVDQWVQLCIRDWLDVVQQLSRTNATNQLLFGVFDQDCN